MQAEVRDSAVPRASVVLASCCVLLLAGCSAPAHRTPPPFDSGYRSGMQGAFASVAPTPSSSADLGSLERYAARIDAEYHVHTPPADWEAVAEYNCSSLQNGAPQADTQPSEFNGVPGDHVVDADGIQTFPILGKAWAASVQTHCPSLLTPVVLKALSADEQAGLRWFAKQR